jgi:hypothetical protein
MSAPKITDAASLNAAFPPIAKQDEDRCEYRVEGGPSWSQQPHRCYNRAKFIVDGGKAYRYCGVHARAMKRFGWTVEPIR